MRLRNIEIEKVVNGFGYSPSGSDVVVSGCVIIKKITHPNQHAARAFQNFQFSVFYLLNFVIQTLYIISKVFLCAEIYGEHEARELLEPLKLSRCIFHCILRNLFNLLIVEMKRRYCQLERREK